jgi:HNH endonuclease
MRRQLKGSMVTLQCVNCSGLFEVRPYRAKKAQFCSPQCHGNYARGTALHPDGRKRYRMVRTKEGKSQLAHRFVMEKFLGRKLDRFELVHHGNNDKSDNRRPNLEVMSPKEHSVHHNQIHPDIKQCAVCNNDYRPPIKHRGRSVTCSRRCCYLLVSLKNRNPQAPKSMYNDNAYPSVKALRKEDCFT